jgi:hypothetical protein
LFLHHQEDASKRWEAEVYPLSFRVLLMVQDVGKSGGQAMSLKAMGRDDLQSLQDKVSMWIGIISAVIASTFAWVQFSNTPLDKVTEVFDQNSFTKIGLCLLIIGLGSGATADTRIQFRILAVDADKGEIGLMEMLGIFIFFAALFGLLWFHETLVLFQALLVVMLVVNAWTFSFVIMKRLEGAIVETEKMAREGNDHLAFMKLYLGTEYLTGNWQKKRFLTLIALAVLQLVVALFLQYSTVTFATGKTIINGVTLDQLVQYLPSFLFVLHVVLSETWMRVYRQRIGSDLETLNLTFGHFRVSKLPKVDLPAINYTNLFRRGRSHAAQYR